MGVKQKIRKQLERVVGKYGYQLVKDPELEQLKVIVDQTEVAFDEAAFKARNPQEITLGWLVPPLGPGAGGHRTIFRTIDNLSKQGIRSNVFIYGPVRELSSDELMVMVKDFYQVDLSVGGNEIYGSPRHLGYVDAVMATSWETAYALKNFNNCLEHFYFVQDYEPYFYGVGSLYYFAENTYKLGYKAITAGHWLDKKLHDEYGMETCGFDFSYDEAVYKPQVKKDNKKRIFFYARPATGRRAFEMGALAFEKLKQMGDDFEVSFAGQELLGYNFSFNYVDHGIVSPSKLSELYGDADICLVMSLTNMSLLPYEIIASGSVCMINGGDNNEWGANESNCIVVDLDPNDIADKLHYYLNNPDALKVKREQGMASLSNKTWFETSIPVAEYIKECIKNKI